MIGFHSDKYNLEDLQKLSNREKLILALDAEDGVIIYRKGVNNFLEEINKNTIDTDLIYWFLIN